MYLEKKFVKVYYIKILSFKIISIKLIRVFINNKFILVFINFIIYYYFRVIIFSFKIF